MMPDFTERHSDKIIATVSCFDRVINRRYLAFLSAVDDPTSWINRVNKISRPVKEAGRSYRGFNHFSPADEAVFHAIAQGGVQGFGIRNSALRVLLGKTSGQVSRVFKRLRNHRLIKKAGNTYKYYCNDIGASGRNNFA